MAPAPRTAVILFAAACLWTQVLVSSALTQEDLLRAAIIDFNTTSFELTSDITLTQSLPPLKLSSGRVRVLKIFSKVRKGSLFSISGAKKYRGFWTPENVPGAEFPVARLTFERIALKDFRVKFSRKLSNAFGSVGFNGGAIGVERTSVAILSCILSGNQASGSGGALYISDGSLLVKGSLISANTATIGGGIDIAAYGKAVTITAFGKDKTVFANNVATVLGGGLNVQLSAAIKISRTVFTVNSAGESGAGFRAIFNSNEQPKKPMLFDSCEFTANTADTAEGAGAIDINGVKEIRLVNPYFEVNTASGVPANIFVTQPPGDVTTIKVQSGVLTDVKGNNPGNFIIEQSP